MVRMDERLRGNDFRQSEIFVREDRRGRKAAGRYLPRAT